MRYPYCEQASDLYFQAAMKRFLRPFLMILVAVAVSVTSSGWSMAAIGKNTPAGSIMRMAAVADSAELGVDHHGVSTTESHATCAADGDCETQPQDTEEVASCCATSCHVAVPTIIGAHNVALFAGRGGTSSLVDMHVDDATLQRLDRPPRTADV